jgi:hypothetical protein
MEREIREINPNMFFDMTIFGCLPLCFAIFLWLRSHRAVVVAFLFAWLFLPVAEYKLAGLPDYTKVSATCWGLAAAAVILDTNRVRQLRFHWIDLFVVLYVASPVLSSLHNGLGLWDGLSGCFEALTVFAVPWFLGRIYFNDVKSLRYLAIGIVVGALIYAPLCLWEAKMSPHLHRDLYGYHLLGFKHASRGGGTWRPMVFMEHGLMVGFYFACATMMAYWLWVTKTVRQLGGVPFGAVPVILAIVTFLLQSSLAQLLMLTGIACFFFIRYARFRLPLIGLVLVFPLYVLIRHLLGWDGAELVEVGRTLFSDRRADSLAYRFVNEDILVARAKESFWLGWGGQGRFLQNQTSEGRGFLTPDGLWLVVFGRKGFLGVIGLAGTILAAPMLAMLRLKTAHWKRNDLAPVTGFVVPITMYMIDCILNAFENPLYGIAAGGVAGLFATRRSTAQLLEKAA